MTHIDQLHPRVQFTDKDGYLTVFAFRFLQATWERVGGPDDFIEDTQNGELYEPGTTDPKLAELIKQVNELELLLELQGNSKINELQNQIKDLEIDYEMLAYRRNEILEYLNFDPKGGLTDAFSRQRVSDTGQRLDVEFIYNKQPDYFDEITNGGSAAVTFNGSSRDLTLTVGTTTNGEYATMRSHPIPYTPGNSQLIDITGVLDLANIGSGTAQTFIRSNITGSVVETTTDQSSWNNAKTGVDWSKSHIFSIDFQSLKVGRIRFFLNQNGSPVFLTEIINDNLRNTGYWQLASLPIYWRIYNDSTYSYMEMGYGDESNAIGLRYRIAANASATMKAICCTAKSEGGPQLFNMPGLPRSINSGITPVTVSTTKIPLLSIRPKTTFQTYANLIISLIKGFNIQTDDPIRVDIVHNGALTGASWADVDSTESSMEYDVTASAITGGHVVHSEYIYASSTGPATRQYQQSISGLLGKTVLWDRKSTETGILSITAIRTSASDASVLSSLQWEEIR